MPVDERLAKLFLSIRSGLAQAVTSIVPPGDVEDIVQETYVRVCRASVANEIRAPRSFMHRTARNIALDHVKRAEFRLVDPTDDVDCSDQQTTPAQSKDTLELVCAYEDFAIFCAAVRELPIQCRRAFVLKKVYGYSQREIAQEMQISEKTVEGHIARGITRCKRTIENQRRGKSSTELSDINRSGSAPGNDKS